MMATGKLDFRKTVWIIAAIAAPLWLVLLGAGDALRESDRPSEYIGLIYSILAASLFATISIVGDPSMLLAGGWRGAWRAAKGIQLRLLRLTYLFVLYLVVLALLVACEVIEFKKLEDYYFMHDIFAFTSALAFILSLWLPFEIKEIQITRLEQEISGRKGNG